MKTQEKTHKSGGEMVGKVWLCGHCSNLRSWCVFEQTKCKQFLYRISKGEYNKSSPYRKWIWICFYLFW